MMVRHAGSCTLDQIRSETWLAWIKYLKIGMLISDQFSSQVKMKFVLLLRTLKCVMHYLTLNLNNLLRCKEQGIQILKWKLRY